MGEDCMSMRYTTLHAGALALGLLLIPAAGEAQQASSRPVEAAQAPQIIVQDADARETREKLEELLRRMPPAVGRVLRTDPSLLGNEGYLSTYPSLAAFVKQHPEIRSAPNYFFEHVGPADFYSPGRPETQQEVAIRMWNDVMTGLAVGGVFLTVTLALIWIIRTLVEYRRWHRTSKVHTEVHNKLLDRFTSNEDLMAYIQTPAGRRFLESAPLMVEGPARPVGAPFGRILLSVQVGIVLATGALGLLYVSGRVMTEVAQPFYVLGVLALTIGVGFVVSAGASILLSRRLGLFEPVVPAREHANAPHTGS
jgi:hypothetical protein